MKKTAKLLMIVALLSVIGCKGKKGKIVTKTMDSGGYTYMLVEENSQKYWVASSKIRVSVGDQVEFKKDMPMRNFSSKSLNQTFDSIYFVSNINILSVGKSSQMPQSSFKPPLVQVKKGDIQKAKNGYTVAEIYAKKSELNGKSIKVRGRVVKVNLNIMGKNWVHIQDGTGDNKTSDLSITTSQKVDIGSVVLVTGKVIKDKNFGSGYLFAVIVEGAKIKIEK